LKKYVSLGDIKNAIDVLENYKEEHHPDGEIYFALAIAIHIMNRDLTGVMMDLMYTDRVARFDS
jgi:hypothetical protein